MAESNEQPTLQKPPTPPLRRPESAPTRSVHDRRGDRRRALEGDAADRRRAADGRGRPQAAVGRRPRGRARGRAERLRPEELRAGGPARPRSDRVPDAPDQRGQEGSPGKRTGKVIGLRGKSLFVNLGGKSEGVLPIEQLEGAEVPAPAPRSTSIVDRFDPDEGIQILRLKGAAIEANWENAQEGRSRRGPRHQGRQGGARGRRQRHPRLHADQPDRPGSGRGRLGVRQPEVQSDRHRGQPARAQPRHLPPRPPGAGTRRAARADLGDPRGGPGPRGRRPLGQGLRRVRRSRRRGRPAPDRRDELVARRQGRRPDPDRRQGHGQGAQDRPDRAEAHARAQAAHPQPVGDRRGQIPARHDGQGEGDADHGVRRVRRARAGRGGTDPHLGALAHAGPPRRRTSSSSDRRWRSGSSRSSRT